MKEKCDICGSNDLITKHNALFCNKCGSLLQWVEEKEDLNEKFLWLQVLHIVEDTLPTDNPATGHKTIEALFNKFEIKLRGTPENQSIH